MTSRSARRQEQLALAGSLRECGQPWHAIATTLRERYNLNARVAMRLAHGWGQADAAAEWNRRWPDDPKTFKNFSYWENWPSPTGHAPPLAVLDRLAQLYECAAADLLAGWAEHRTEATPAESADVLAWQVRNLDLQELTRALSDWVRESRDRDRRTLLLKLSTAAALCAAELDTGTRRRHSSPVARLGDLVGIWESRYRYRSRGRDAELEDTHRVEFQVADGQLLGRSLPDDTGSVLELWLSLEGTVATGTWTERTSPTGHYRAATYQGTLQLVVDPTGRSMTGRWLGVGKRFTVNSGEWELCWAGQADR